MKFIADGMLGKLARWLRLAGHDVVYIGDSKMPPEQQDDALVKRAKLERRILLTSDLALHRRALKRGARSTFIKSADVVSQLVETSRRVGQRIEIVPENSRCPMCNGSLRAASRQDVGGLVPETVLKAQREFWQCVKCKKIYWHGKHWKTIIEMASRYNQIAR
ncbi:MAG: Mut7-C RNAse domain-containing protein [Candidatus Hodarchaeaceae archaeon]|nr:Mut7-C RNAse domain-containing protein [Candidatus Hodarchaeaceae archaeon]